MSFIKKSKRGWLAAYVGVVLAWGSTFIFIDGALGFLSPVGVAFVRYALGALFMVVYGALQGFRFPREGKLLAHLFVLSFVNNSLFGVLLAAAQTEVTSALAGITAAIVPLMTLFFVGVVFRSERLEVHQIIGLIIGFFGALFVVGIWRGVGENPLWAILALLGCTMCYGFSYPYAKKFIIPSGIGPQVMATTMLCWTTLTLLPFFVAFGLRGLPESVWQVTAALGVGFVSSGIAFLWNFTVIDRAGSLVASSTMYFIPFVAIALGLIFLGEQVLWNQLVGALIVVFAAIVGQGRLGRLQTRNSPASLR